MHLLRDEGLHLSPYLFREECQMAHRLRLENFPTRPWLTLACVSPEPFPAVYLGTWCVKMALEVTTTTTVAMAEAQAWAQRSKCCLGWKTARVSPRNGAAVEVLVERDYGFGSDTPSAHILNCVVDVEFVVFREVDGFQLILKRCHVQG